ncbi:MULTISPECIES: cysteine desulfurase family protein [Allobacillus]|uniref:cysteine desulfurase n=1 Tax=Allobacillus halotolerans TaxID=570278 RepID=A0ABS6GQF1_9BACI|nr:MULTISPECIES: cysteine desulfurase family protein [Allobacillus]MBU6080662.1 cysteine desulfurase [Allobacillus halotolerans]TSJ68298.1 cysteine desulfurase [Allobacillus sp. SKP2-8]
MKRVYLDYAATTPLHPEVKQEMMEALEGTYGNPSSIHSFGRESRKLLDEARSEAARSIGADFSSIIFTSGATEANNLAIFGVARAHAHKGKHIITTQIEHHAVLHPMEELEKEGFEVTFLPVDESGVVSVEAVEEALRPDTIFVSIMRVNNETGMQQPIEAIGERLKEHQAIFHTDAVQAYGLEKLDVTALNVDLLSVSSHKIYGPKGIGFLYRNDDIHLAQQIFGGEQERKWRSGTENMLGIVGFKKAIELLEKEREDRMTHYQRLSEKFIAGLNELSIDYHMNGKKEEHMPNILNISFPGVEVEMFLTNLDLEGIAVSSGSACTAGSIDPSHVLKAMYGEKNDRIYNSIRFSFGIETSEEEIQFCVERISKILNRLLPNHTRG